MKNLTTEVDLENLTKFTRGLGAHCPRHMKVAEGMVLQHHNTKVQECVRFVEVMFLFRIWRLDLAQQGVAVTPEQAL